MAKKVRRVKKNKKSSATQVVEDSVEQPAETEDAMIAKGTSAKDSRAESFRQEYAYVVKDLKRVLLVSGAMFVLLIVVNLLFQ